jgi:hypothetical protein
MHEEATEVVEAVPGRLRLHVPGLGRDYARAEELRHKVEKCPGVQSVHVGLLSNHLTVDFDPAETHAVLSGLDEHFPEANLTELNLERALLAAVVEPEGPSRPNREDVRLRAAGKRRRLAAMGAAVVGVLSGLVLRKLLNRK